MALERLAERLDLIERIVLEMGGELKSQHETWFALGDLLRELRELRDADEVRDGE